MYEYELQWGWNTHTRGGSCVDAGTRKRRCVRPVALMGHRVAHSPTDRYALVEMGRLLGGLFSHAGGTDALRKARQRSRTVGGPMGPALFATSGPMGHKRHEGPEVPTVTIHHPCVRLLSITLACCQEPVQTKKRVEQTRTGVTSDNHAITRY